MHPTADTTAFKFLNLVGRRVMRGVRFLLRYGILPINSAGGSE
jgi:hypothetical protein